MSIYDSVGWDSPEDPEDDIGYEVSPTLVQVGRDHSPRHPKPEFFSEREKSDFALRWGHGEPVVTPVLASHLASGELELYAGVLPRKLRYYAWSRADGLGTGRVDPEGLVQDALIERWTDPRDLPSSDVERFAIRAIRFAARDISAKAKNRAQAEERSLVLEAPEFVTLRLPTEYWEWIQCHLPERSAEAVRLVLEEQYTQQEAAKEVKIGQSAVSKAFSRLREQASDLRKE